MIAYNIINIILVVFNKWKSSKSTKEFSKNTSKHLAYCYK